MTPIRSFALLVSVLAGLFPTVPAAAPVPPEAERLLARHIAWLGGLEALETTRDLVMEGSIAVSGLAGTLVVQARADGFQRVEYDLKVVSGVEVVTPQEGWERNASGQIEEMGRDKARDQRRAMDRAFGRHLRGEGVGIEALPAEEKDGKRWEVVRFTYPEGDAVDLFLDPADGSSEWSRETRDGETIWTHTGDFRQVDGLRAPFRQETLYENAIQNQTVTWTRIARNTGIDEARFARPGAGAQIVRLAGDAISTDWIPMDLHMGRYIYLDGTVNGEPSEIVLDSGAGITVIDKPVVERLGLIAEGSLAARGTGGTTQAGIVKDIRIAVGTLEIGPVTAATLDLADVNRRMGRDLPVILGKEVFHNVIVDIDYPGSRIRFHDPARFTYEGPGRRLPVLPAEDGHKDVEIRIEGLPPAVVGLDTGQGGALSVFRAYTDGNRLLEERTTSSAKGGGVGGATIFTMATIDSVTIAGYTLRDVPAAFHRENVGGAFDTARQAGNLGAGILSRFRVLFDYPHECLWLEPGTGWDSRPFARDKTGLSPRFDGDRLVVEYVAPGSPAEAAGWKEGEVITAVDGDPVGPAWWDRYLAWSLAPDGTTVSLTLVDGSTRALTMRTYY